MAPAPTCFSTCRPSRAIHFEICAKAKVSYNEGRSPQVRASVRVVWAIINPTESRARVANRQLVLHSAGYGMAAGWPPARTVATSAVPATSPTSSRNSLPPRQSRARAHSPHPGWGRPRTTLACSHGPRHGSTGYGEPLLVRPAGRPQNKLCSIGGIAGSRPGICRWRD